MPSVMMWRCVAGILRCLCGEILGLLVGEMGSWRGVVKGVFCELVCCVGVAFAWVGRAVQGSFASGHCAGLLDSARWQSRDRRGLAWGCA